MEIDSGSAPSTRSYRPPPWRELSQARRNLIAWLLFWPVFALLKSVSAWAGLDWDWFDTAMLVWLSAGSVWHAFRVWLGLDALEGADRGE